MLKKNQLHGWNSTVIFEVKTHLSLSIDAIMKYGTPGSKTAPAGKPVQKDYSSICNM